MSKKVKNRGIGEVLYPKVNKAIAITASAGSPGSVLDVFEDHLGTADNILLAALDVAEVGRREAEAGGDGPNNERFIVIQDLLALYRSGNSALIEGFYRSRHQPKVNLAAVKEA